MIKLQLTTQKLILADDVKRLVNKSLKKLDKYLTKYPPDLVKAVIMLKKRVHRSEDDIYVVSIALYIPKKILHAREDGYTLEESLNEGMQDIINQLKKLRKK